MQNAPAEQSPPTRRRRWPRFSVLTLLLFVTAVCIALGLLYRQSGCEAEAAFRVQSRPPALLEDAAAFDAGEFDIYRQSQIELIKNRWLLQSALRNPKVASLPILAGSDDPVTWLHDRLIVEFPSNSEILSIRLRGRPHQTTDVRVLVDAVAKAYEEQVLIKEEAKRISEMEALTLHVRGLNEDIKGKLQEFPSYPSKPDVEGSTSKLRRMEIDLLIEQWQEATKTLQQLNAERSAPPRVQRLHDAMVTEW
jgi:hypothetical protein